MTTVVLMRPTGREPTPEDLQSWWDYMTKPPPIRLVGNVWEVTHDFAHIGFDLQARDVRAGFKTDLASLPWWVGFAVQKHDERRARAAIPHDLYYRLQLHDVDQMAADRAYRRDLDFQGYPLWRSRVSYLGLRAGGRKAWKNNASAAPGLREEWGYA